MRIIYLHQYFSLPTSAGGTRSYDLAKRFTAAGHKVIMVTSSSFLKNLQPFTEKWTCLDYEGIELHVLHLEYSNKMGFVKRIMAFIKFLLFSSVRILKIKADAVLATSTPITIAIPALVKRARHKTPFIFEVRDVWPEVPIAMGIIRNKPVIGLLKRFEKNIYKKSKHIVALSEDMKHSIISRTQVPEEKITVIPNISEVNRFAAFNPEEQLIGKLVGFVPRKVVLYAGTLGMVNGLKYMVDLAIHSFTIDPSIIYMIVGDGMEKESLVKYAEEHRVLGKNLFFIDPVPKSQLPQLYYEATVASSFVIPIKELWANSANKFFDCLAASRPVVINHLGWQADEIHNNNIGFVLNHDVSTVKEETVKFCRYLNDDVLLEQQKQNAGALAVKKYSLDVASQKYLTILGNVLS